ncbi:serine hydrolase domain-containing protein [Salinimicrobium sediminilitoris]|uniref:serine hydrolase domain-containing protein n=1 Tax=Salinimicrobium sediminilitoris TaxID=2876715 RepID=UPI001E384D43|nr:serine hydrolase domain-containing protein [Salinimicrobium sediminilitoris]MCC8359847.1 beta-lactamase family protein [Salinimicrobium sediminilitoris]
MTRQQTKLIITTTLIVGTVISLFFVPWIVLKAWILPLPDTVEEQVEEITNYGFDGVIVYINQEGQKPEFYAAGWKDKERKIPASSSSLFKIASIGKLYDAVAIAKLVNDKHLSLSKTVADYFPELVGRIENAERITLEMMVKHRSGIPNLTDTPDFWINLPKSSEEALERVLDLQANFEPGEKYEYSNTNYLLITELIEKVTGRSKFQYIEDEILLPLELKNTYASIHDVNLDDVMSGYYVGVEEDIKTTDYGSMLATAEDVGIFLRALNDGSLFEGEEQMIYSSIYGYDHTGLIPGFQSIARYHKDIDAVVIQFTNTTDFDGYKWNLSEIFYNRIVKILRKGKNT